MRKFYDLTQTLWEYSPKWVAQPEVTFFDLRIMSRDGILTRGIRTSLHAGTHLDAPRHFGFGMALDEIPLDVLCGTGVVIDIPKAQWEGITVQDLENARPEILSGDRVIVHTGWHHHYEDEETYMVKYPGFTKPATDWLVKKGISLIGSDTPSPDHPFCLISLLKNHRPDVFTNEVIESIDTELYPPLYNHRTFLGNNIPMAEQLGGEIDDVLGRRLNIIALTPKYHLADGSQVRVIAFE